MYFADLVGILENFQVPEVGLELIENIPARTTPAEPGAQNPT